MNDSSIHKMPRDDIRKALDFEKEQMHAALSHHLKAPLRAIHNFANFLLEDLGETLSAEHQTYLKHLALAASQQRSMIEGMRRFCSGPTSETLIRTDLAVFITEFKAGLSLSPDVRIEWGEDWPVMVTCPVLLRSILENLIDNAIKFNRSTPKVVEIGSRMLEAGGVELYVSDNGIGVEAWRLDKVFDLLDSESGDEGNPGSGIGLALVKRSVLTLGGSVEMQVNESGGSVFKLFFPQHTNKEPNE